jgi:uncharacterized YigZ family protein
MAVIRTLRERLVHETAKVKGSRFIAAVAPLTSEDEANAFIDERRTEHAAATHNAFAWILNDKQSRSGDDGEVSGTAGRPILREIEGRGLVGVAVVVTRYYGGTRLGTGGLVRAYSGAAAAGLDAAGIVESRVVRTLRLRFPYDLTVAVRASLHAFDASEEAAEYGEDVRLEVAVAEEDADGLAAALKDATAGRIDAIPG